MLGVMRATLLLLGLFAAGCGSDETTDVPAECKATVETLANKNADCAVATGAIAAEQRAEYVATFTAGVTTTLDCSRQTKVNGNPDACAMEMNAMPCTLFDKTNGLPIAASCKGLYAK
jgi:hypothetical protein